MDDELPDPHAEPAGQREETMRVRPGDIDRRALPFRGPAPGGQERRRARDQAPAPEAALPDQAETDEERTGAVRAEDVIKEATPFLGRGADPRVAPSTAPSLLQPPAFPDEAAAAAAAQASSSAAAAAARAARAHAPEASTAPAPPAAPEQLAVPQPLGDAEDRKLALAVAAGVALAVVVVLLIILL